MVRQDFRCPSTTACDFGGSPAAVVSVGACPEGPGASAFPQGHVNTRPPAAGDTGFLPTGPLVHHALAVQRGASPAAAERAVRICFTKPRV